MLILKIINVFLPVSIAEVGNLCDYMNPPYIGFETEVIEERSWDQKVVADSKLVGTRHLILEKHTQDSAAFHKDDVVSVPSGVLTQGLLGLSVDEWLAQPSVTVNNHSKPFIKRHTL